MNALQTATLAARSRTKDKQIGVHVRQGKFQVVRVTYGKRGASTVTPLSEWMEGFNVIAFLNELRAAA